MLAPHHRLDVLPEDKLAVRVVFRFDHVDGLVRIDGQKARLGQGLRQAGADHLGALQAQNGVHNGGAHVFFHQFFGHGLRLAQAGFHGGHINIIIDVAVVGGKVTRRNFQRHIPLADGQLDQVQFHG